VTDATTAGVAGVAPAARAEVVGEASRDPAATTPRARTHEWVGGGVGTWGLLVGGCARPSLMSRLWGWEGHGSPAGGCKGEGEVALGVQHR